jgi:hypothetical protein
MVSPITFVQGLARYTGADDDQYTSLLLFPRATAGEDPSPQCCFSFNFPFSCMHFSIEAY